MKRALVLSGGGSKGAYEVGFIRALNELNISIDIVTGTSIGALNGALYAMRRYDQLETLWNTIEYNSVFKEEPIELNFDIDKDLILTNLKSFINHKGADISPLKNTITSLLDEERLLSSSIDFGLCCVEYPKLKPLMITKNQMDKDLIADYLIASASAFPLFPVHFINGQGYIDGGYADNLPIDLALDMGADEIIVVDLNQQPTHPYYINRPNILYTTPSTDLGAFLEFSREKIERNIRLGYQSAMKLYNHYVGNDYTFKLFETDMFHIMYKEILKLERHARSFIKNETNYIYNQFLESNKNILLKENDYLYIILDWFCELMNRDISYVYDYHLLIRDLMLEFEKYTDKDYKLIDFNEFEGMPQVLKDVNRKVLIGRIYHGLLYPQEEVFDIEKIMRLFSKEIIMAYFLYHIYEQKTL